MGQRNWGQEQGISSLQKENSNEKDGGQSVLAEPYLGVLLLDTASCRKRIQTMPSRVVVD
ncbi:hypothetical protein NEUTE2DRAFT_125081 [Neurospora tetrasperma FGSC 2509]|nr:hypothetical protein NEUTE2DRAFT_125081 [Neurospora tetrasperma FGSC 2509]